MPTRDELMEILTSFMNTASPEEIRELKALLKNRRGPAGPGALNFTGMAEQIAASIKQQMGLSEKAMRETAVAAVSKLIRSYAPDISDHDQELLLKAMLPSLAETKRSPLPRDMLKAMVDQFVEYSLGRMKQPDIARMPEGWAAKYWNAFPPVIRELIAKLLHSEIDEELFHLATREAIRRLDPGQSPGA